MCAHMYDVALCGNTVRNVALGLSLVDHPCIGLLGHTLRTVYARVSNTCSHDFVSRDLRSNYADPERDIELTSRERVILRHGKT